MVGKASQPSDDAHWLDVAIAIADGAPVDWSGLGGSMPPDSPADLPGRLQAIERVVRGHDAVRRASATDDDRSGADTILTAARRRAAIEEAAGSPLVVRWGPLVVTEKVGRGSFGDVYRAWDPRLEREVALKVVPEPEASRSRTVIDEGRLLAKIRHPNVLTVYGAERVEGRAGIWTEFVEGEDLARRVASRGPLDVGEAARIGHDVCRALGAVHDAGLLHRDVKAQNVLRDASGRVVLGDFGSGASSVALEADDDARSAPGPAGTPLYLAPELFAGEGPSAGSDLYSLGVLLYFLLTGRFPVDGRSLADVRAAHEAGRRTSLREARPDLPPALVAVIDRLLTPDRRARFSSAGMAAAALEKWLASGRGERPTARDRTRRHAAVLGVGALGFLALAIWWQTGAADSPDAATGVEGLGAGTVSRQVSDAPCPGVPSLGGTWLCAERALGAPLVLFDAVSGATTTLVASPAGTAPVSWVLSPDGQQAAYVAFAPSSRTFEVRLSDVATGQDRILVPPPDGDVTLRRWAPEGRIEVVRGSAVSASGEGQSFELLDPSDGTFAKIFDLPDGSNHVSRSPDGRFVVIEQADAGSNRRLQLCELESGACRAVAPHAASNFLAAFTPDGGILFNSDRTGTNGLWRVELDGFDVSPPELVRDLGRMGLRVLGFAADGAMYYELSLDEFDVFSVRLDFEDAGAPVRLMQAVLGSARSPVWSPDGQWLAYLRRPGVGSAVRVVVQSQRDGSEQDFPVDARLQPNFGLTWSPDGTTLALRTVLDATPTLYGIHLLDPEEGRLIKTLPRPGANGRSIIDAIWLDDGRLLLGTQRGIIALDIDTGQETVVWNDPPAGGRVFGRLALSPDRSTIAFVVTSPATPRPDVPSVSWLKLLSLADGSVRDLVVERTVLPPPTWVQTFSPDGSSLFVTRVEWPEDWWTAVYHTLPARLWRVPLDGNEPEALPLTAVGLDEVTLSADGSRLAYSARISSPSEGFWVDRVAPTPPRRR